MEIITKIQLFLSSVIEKVPQRFRLPVIIGAPAALVAVAILVVAVAMASGGSSSGNDGNGGQVTVSGTPTATGGGLLTENIADKMPLQSEDLANRQAENGVSGTNPDAPVPGGEGDRLVISTIGVDARLTMRVVGGDGKMPNPEGPTDVVWYDFSSFNGLLGGRPGVGGNTVLSGHVDYHDYGPAVFWDLQKLDPGQELTIRLRDGTEYKYVIQWNKVVEQTSTAWNEIVASTSQESVTIITCAGDFDPETRSYDQRRVVWATRVS